MHYSRGLQRIELSKEEFPRTWEALQAGLAQGVSPGFVIGLWFKKQPETVWIAALGQRRVTPSPLPIFPDTPFDLASVSKVFATATLTALLIDRKWLRWDLPLRALLPSYPFREIQLSHLLSHTAGLPAWNPLFEKLKERFAPQPLYKISIQARQNEMRKQVMALKPEVPVGEKCVYSDISSLLLGFALEEATQLPLDHAVQRLLWKPMGVQDAFYARVDRSVEKGRLDLVAATEESVWRGGVLQGQVHDDNCWAMGGYGGHAGAFGSVQDVLHFSKMLMGGFLSRETLNVTWTRVSRPLGCERTLGWDTPSVGSSAGQCFSKNSVGHLGYTGTSLWIDLDAELAVCLLTNRVHPIRENEKIKTFRPRFHDAIRIDFERKLSLE